ncbi:nuclear transport factor 2 family protein [Ulvibacterium sp.]|uniref:nuclear transport factor 2 family protein n=1 Tax=Ulvibacterium sp. TaxID=2665914 RepID=UPI003BA99C2C
MTTIVKFLLILLLSFFSFMGFAHVSDEKAIEQVATDYMENYYKSGRASIENATRYEVTETRIGNGEASQLLKSRGYPESASPARLTDEKVAKRPIEHLRITVEILDMDEDVASIGVRTDPHDFYDYMRLAKIDGEWEIVNVLWDNRRV